MWCHPSIWPFEQNILCDISWKENYIQIHSLWYIMKRELYSNWSFLLLQHNVKEVGGGEEPVGQPPLKGLASCPLSDQQCDLDSSKYSSLEPSEQLASSESTRRISSSTLSPQCSGPAPKRACQLPPAGPAVQSVESRELESWDLSYTLS